MRITIRPACNKITIPPTRLEVKRCPNCHSTEIMGYGMIIGYGHINLEDLSVDEPSDDFELFSAPENLEHVCQSCDHRWKEE